MNASVIEIGTTRPYPHLPQWWSTAHWQRQPARLVSVAGLITTQNHLDIAALLSGRLREGSDRYPHIVEYDGRRYIEDGHHRVVRAILQRQRRIVARIVCVDSIDDFFDDRAATPTQVDGFSLHAIPRPRHAES